MKVLIFISAILLIPFKSLNNTHIYCNDIVVKEEVCESICEDYVTKDVDDIVSMYELNIPKYLNTMSYLESRGRYDVVNRFGYMGKYQFSKRTLIGLKNNGYLNFDNLDMGNFLKNKQLQEDAMMALVANNLNILSRYGLMKFQGKIINGNVITLEGMLAASHLTGPYSVKRYLQSYGSKNYVDGNGTSVEVYISKFA